MESLESRDIRYMQMAMDLARKGVGWTSPNPMVGALVVKDGEIVGQGYHEQYGHAHAEVNALNEAGKESIGATLYLTLEPCFHHGKTPPCVERVILSQVARVVIAHEDPNPKVAGKSVAALKEAGIEVHVGCLEKEARLLNEGFRKWIATGVPFVHAKIAMTLDGKMASKSYDSCWITNEESRRQVHWMRALYDSILVGIGTVLHDDPMLTCRLPEQGRPWRQPLRIILDPEEQLPATSRVVRTANEIPTLLVLSEPSRQVTQWNDLGVETMALECLESVFNLRELLSALGKRKITSVLVEGGPRTQTLFWEQAAVDKYTFFIAPKIIGGERALSPIVGDGIEKMCDAQALEDVSFDQYGNNLAISGYPLRSVERL